MNFSFELVFGIVLSGVYCLMKESDDMYFKIIRKKRLERKDFFAENLGGEGYWKNIEETKAGENFSARIHEKDLRLEQSIEKAEYSAETFLLASNTGGAVALIGLARFTPTIFDSVIVALALGLFVLSVVFVGLIKAIRISRNYHIRGEWRKNSYAFYSNSITAEELVKRDSFAWRDPTSMILLAWGAYIFFIIGVAMSIYGVSEVLDLLTVLNPSDKSN